MMKNEEILKRFPNIYDKKLVWKITSKQTESKKFVDELIEKLDKLNKSCTICNRLNKTMDRYVDVILYLYFKEEDFKNLFDSQKAFV